MDVKFIDNKLKMLDAHYKHPSYFLEQKLLHEISHCQREDALKTLDTINQMERAILAKDQMRSVKNSLIASCTLFSRAAIQAAVTPEDVFAMSDALIYQLETLYLLEDVKTFEYEMVNKFIDLIAASRTSHHSPQIASIITYINDNITEPLTLKAIARQAKYSKEHLSRIFKKEMNMTVNEYINMRKVEVSKMFLDNSYMTIHDIAIIMNFCNSSYYSKTFKHYLGLSPRDYRRSKRL